MKHEFKEGDGVVCDSVDEARKLLALAIKNGYKVYRGSINTDFNSFYFDEDKEFVGCIDIQIENPIPKEEFIALVTGEKTTKQMKNPRTLNQEQAKKIINCACSTWKPKLLEAFKNLLLHDEIIIEESYYQEMRKACTADQHIIFDEIFGKDIKGISTDNLKIGEAAMLTEGEYKGEIVLKTFSNYVLLDKPDFTWSSSPSLKCRRVKLTITHQEID